MIALVRTMQIPAEGEEAPIEWFGRAAISGYAVRRIKIFMSALWAALLILFAGVAHVLLMPEKNAGEHFARAGRRRPDILDRRGNPMTMNLVSYDLWINPRQMADTGNIALLAGITPVPPVPEDGRRIRVQRNMKPEAADMIMFLGEPGFELEKTSAREYPDPMFAHILGSTDVDNRGMEGIEKYIDDNGLEAEREIRLSIDSYVQEVAHRRLGQAMAEMKALFAAGIVMDSKTGEILALVSLPDWPGGRNPKADKKYNNHAVLDVFELGSVMKIFNHALAIESGYPADRTFNVARPFMVGGYRVRDSHPPKNVINMDEAFAYSSNIASAMIARDLGPELQAGFFARLGFKNKMPFELPERGSPLWPKKWTEHTNSTAAYGYGVSISMLHFIAAANAILNDGMYVPPTILKRASPPEIRQVVKIETSREIKRLMKKVMDEGTGQRLGLRGSDVGGKTGTAQKLGPDGTYRDDRMRTFFFGAYPIDNPRITFVVMLDEADNNGCALASCTAAAAGTEIIRELREP
ncbi:MAG: penicillin-binding protein 2 [Rickettsiales bacterium]|jgi:cell division protein FtsI (penicillin-binding protein 3)|nr:penicillin-binding protein 2 [Rickettsiales bacterium]